MKFERFTPTPSPEGEKTELNSVEVTKASPVDLDALEAVTAGLVEKNMALQKESVTDQGEIETVEEPFVPGDLSLSSEARKALGRAVTSAIKNQGN